jgi:hypothetical protein
MASDQDIRTVTQALARQGYTLAPERAQAVADAAADLAAAARRIEQGLPFAADLYGFATLLAGWRTER